MKRTVIISSLLLLSSAFVSAQDYKGLKEIIGKDFKIGVAVTPWQINGDDAKLITHNYNTMTAENVMKPASIARQDGTFNWQQADQIVDFARKNGMQMRGHTLVWHASTPQWYCKDAEGNDLTKEALYAKHENYIREVLQHFPSDIVFCWDVVNEALADVEGQGLYRTQSPWYKICGPDYIAWAFRTAKKYAPKGVKLYYNDYNLVDPAKLERAYQMLKGLVDAGVPIDGVGMQAHWSNDVTEQQIQNAIDRFSSLGLDIQFTEMDLTIYDNFHGPGAAERQKSKVTLPYDENVSKAQADEYEMIFKVLHRNRKKISSVTFWNVNDNTSWLNNFPIRGRIDYPLLFDRQSKPKEAYFRIARLYGK